MRTLAVFGRLPVLGQVKTRLSPALPPSLAVDLYGAMLADCLAVASAAGADQRVLYWADDAGAARDFPVPAGFIDRGQVGSDLGTRLQAAFAELLTDPADRAVVIGADCPDLGAAAISEAFDALAAHDLVLGPASDGGYYLVGLRRLAPAIFEGIPWGTSRVLEETLERARPGALAVALLGGLDDLDTPADLVRFVTRRSLDSVEPGRQTEAALRKMGLLPPRS